MLLLLLVIGFNKLQERTVIKGRTALLLRVQVYCCSLLVWLLLGTWPEPLRSSD